MPTDDKNAETSLGQAVSAADPGLRAALADILDRFGAKDASLQIELPTPAQFEEDPQWSGNLYKYVF